MMTAGKSGLLLVVLAPMAFAWLVTPAHADPMRPGAEHCVVGVAPDDPLNLRAGPGAGHRVVTRLPYARCGLIVTASCRGNWCPVEDGHHAGWAHRRFIAAVSPGTNCLRPGQAVALRAWPAEQSRALTRLAPQGCDIALLPYQVAGWQKIRQGGWEGWVRLSDLLSNE
ncbi:SH3 domain-containing protein [Tabrizicola sp. YIM 78059]|uniref:SH3 domain-containing protein n=1 Tax=Tabrizicola sp. YIM 78059 TaxID=2529861 RepID=UPI0010AB322E|nr:SH3 domain-containing protein [Tabrizicola sp. YIM 78059]